jgi:hypothetical protein
VSRALEICKLGVFFFFFQRESNKKSSRQQEQPVQRKGRAGTLDSQVWGQRWVWITAGLLAAEQWLIPWTGRPRAWNDALLGTYWFHDLEQIINLSELVLMGREKRMVARKWK